MKEKHELSLEQDCVFVNMTQNPPSASAKYRCEKEPKIDEFFHSDYADYDMQMLGKTYAYYLKRDPNEVVAAFTIANSALVIDLLPSSRKNKINQEIPHAKHRRQYPALLLCQFAVFDDYAGNRIGAEVTQQIKNLALLLNSTTGCRFLMVEAVNKPEVLKFYERNKFLYLYSTEADEISSSKRKVDENGRLYTRVMYYDMIQYTAN